MIISKQIGFHFVKKILKKYFKAGLTVFILILVMSAEAQNIDELKDQLKIDASKIELYKKNPVWKDMIDQPGVNFFEVQLAFQLFWKDKELPLEEDEVIGERRHLKNNLLNRTFNARELKEQQERNALAFDYKKYCWWIKKTEPYIHDDGTVMTYEERLALWKRHYEELDNSGEKN